MNRIYSSNTACGYHQPLLMAEARSHIHNEVQQEFYFDCHKYKWNHGENKKEHVILFDVSYSLSQVQTLLRYRSVD